MKYQVNIRATVDVAMDIEVDAESFTEAANQAYYLLANHLYDCVNFDPAYMIDVSPCSGYVEEVIDGAPGESMDVPGEEISC